jgi:hypothetical protein
MAGIGHAAAGPCRIYRRSRRKAGLAPGACSTLRGNPDGHPTLDLATPVDDGDDPLP